MPGFMEIEGSLKKRLAVPFLSWKARFPPGRRVVRAEEVAFEIGDELSLAINYDRVERMHEQRFFRIKIHVEPACHLLDLWQRSSEKMPSPRIRPPGARIVGKGRWLIVRRINYDTQQNEIAAHACAKALLQLAEVIRQAKAVIG